jgi:hypothetical protein
VGAVITATRNLWGQEVLINPLASFKSFENHLEYILKEKYEYVIPQKNIGKKPTGKGHVVDVCLEKEKILVSAKLQNGPGTAEEKIPFEMLMLQYACENFNYKKAYVVCAGLKWSLLDYYLSEEFTKQMSSVTPNVKVIHYDDFIKIIEQL